MEAFFIQSIIFDRFLLYSNNGNRLYFFFSE